VTKDGSLNEYYLLMFVCEAYYRPWIKGETTKPV
jgi:hypothetical protein